MLPTYRAILRSGQIDWGAAGPPVLPTGPVPVDITILPASSSNSRGPAMAAVLEAFAAVGGPATIGDPAEWQRDERMDRPVPGRSE